MKKDSTQKTEYDTFESALRKILTVPKDEVKKGRINTPSATRRDGRAPSGRLFTCVLLGTLSPDPWDLPLWARNMVQEKAKQRFLPISVCCAYHVNSPMEVRP